jgi:excisionase family DNA binding protein
MTAVVSESKATGLRVRDVASRLGVSERLVWRLISTGEIRAVRIGQRSTRVTEGDLAAYLDSRPTVGASN